MKEIKSKIYYEILTGKILTITSEYQGLVEETTKEKDMNLYLQLKDKDINEVDFIELEYGTLATTFTNAKSYKINVETKKLDLIYYIKEELDAINQKNQETQDLNARVSDISQYINNNQNTIASVEDLIIQTEQNKIINGGV